MKRVKVNFNFKSLALVLFALVLSSNVWGTDYSNEPFAFTSSTLASGLSTTGTFNSSYYKMSSGNTAKIMASNMFKSEILSSNNMSIVVGCGTFGTWSNPKTIKLTAQFMDKDNKELSKAEHTTTGLGGNVSYSTAFTLAKPEDPSKISYLLITFSNFNSTSSGTARLGTIKLTYSTAAAEKYTVTFNAGSGTCGTSSLTESSPGAGVTLPAASPSSACGTEGWTFAGWKETSAQAETTTKPTLFAAGSNYKPSANCTLYAVYGKTESSGGGSTTESVTWSSRYSGTTDVEGVELTIGTNAKVTHNKGSNSNKCQYYDTGTGIRVYGGGNFVVTASGSDITAISLTFGSGDGSNTITADAGTYSSGSWSGKAASVTFSVGGSSGHRRIAGISVTYSGGSTTTYNSNPSCATCTNLITITKGTLSNGSFELSQTGEVCIDEGNATVNVTDIAPAEHYHFSRITATNGTVDNENKKVTNISANTTINVEFAADTKYTISFLDNIQLEEVASKEVYGGARFMFPDLTDKTATIEGTCEQVHYHFMGWVISTHTGEITVGDIKTGTSDAVNANATYKAVWAAEQQ